MKTSTVNNSQTSFKSIYFSNYNSKYNGIRPTLENETERFFRSRSNVSKIGEGNGGITYKFLTPTLSNLVIKTTKPSYVDDYSKEYSNLMSIPTDIIGGQEAVARAHDSSGAYALISTLVKGEPASVRNRFNEAHLRALFNKMFELDKLGIYHGDLNGQNILLNSSGQVNFIDYQWTQIVPQINFYDSEKVEKMLLPRTVFPENAQMFEMATMPYYIENLPSSSEKENFLRKYLQEKAAYHDKRAKFIETLIPKWYSNEMHLIQKSLREEKAKRNVYRNPSDSVIKLELKKLQFLSDYRDAYSHVDPNVTGRNIIPASSSYLCALSTVQDLRKSVSKELMFCYDSDKKEYLHSLQTYGDYWYENLKEYTGDTFDYIMRALTNDLNFDERKHHFYVDERNPRDISPNRDLLIGVSEKYKTVFDRNFNVPENLYYIIGNMYDDAARSIGNALSYDKKSQHNIDKIRSVSTESKTFNSTAKYLDLLNVSQLGVLKIREFEAYIRHNLSSYSAQRAVNDLLNKSVSFTKNLFNTMFNGLKQESANRILVKGYCGMRQFKAKI